MSKVALLDCNNFFVSCERLFRPDLWGRPVAVLSSNDGCIVARSQEVKDLGVPMGIPYFKIKELCKKEGVTLFSGNLTLYRDISARVMQVLAEEVGACEVYSIDEAFFSVPDSVTEEDACYVRDLLLRKVGVPVTIGIADTKTLAKVASDVGKKKEGFYILTNNDWQQRAEEFRCGSVWGLGRQTATKLSEMGVRSASAFMQLERSVVRQKFGLGTERVYDELHGISTSKLAENSEMLRQSIASTRSFAVETTDLSVLESAVAQHVVHIAQKLRERNLCASRMYIQLQTNRYGDFFMQGSSKEVILSEPTAQTVVLVRAAMKAAQSEYKANVPYKKIGVTVSGLCPESFMTQNLFDAADEETEEKGALDAVTDMLNEKFGRGAVRPAVLLKENAKSNAKLRSQEYTTLWKDIPTVYTK